MRKEENQIEKDTKTLECQDSSNKPEVVVPNKFEQSHTNHNVNSSSPGNGGNKSNTINENEHEIKINDAVVVLSDKEKQLRKKEKILHDMYDHAYTVKENDIVAIKIPEENEDVPIVISPLEKRRRKIWCITLVGIIFSMLVISGFITILVFKNRKNNNDSNSFFNTEELDEVNGTITDTPNSTITEAPTSTLPPTTVRFMENQEKLKNQNISSQAWSNPVSPQYRALDWISNYDNFQSDDLSIDRVVQRYSLATFYYALEGEKWEKDLHFLTNVSECLWNDGSNGVFCHTGSNDTHTIWIGKFGPITSIHSNKKTKMSF